MLVEDQKLFRWGVLLAWVPLVVVFLPFLVTTIRDTRSNMATGLGALAGSYSEGLTTFGLLAFVASEITGISLLVRSMSREHAGRSVGAGVSIGCAGLGLLLIGLVIWFMMSMR